MDPADISQLDLQNITPEQAAQLARQQQAALAAQQHHALLGLLSASPELQKAGEMEYGQASRERAGGKEQSSNVLKYSLEKLGQERQLAALNLQGEQIRGQLGIAQSQLQLQALEPFIRSMLEAQTEEEKIKAVTSHFGPLGEKLGNLLSGPAQAKRRASEKVLDKAEKVVGGKGPKSALPQSTGQAPTPVPAAPAVPAAPGADPWAAMRQKYGGLAKSK